jgi:hypothetical protein
MKRLDRALLDLAETGVPQGADALLHGIEAELGDDVVVGFPGRPTPTRTRPGRRLRWIAAAAAATLLLLGGPVVLWTANEEPADLDVVTTIPQPVTTLLENPTPSTIGIPTTTTTVVPPALDITWTRLESPVFENGWVGAIAVGGPGYIAVGGSTVGLDAAVWISGDGLEWTRIESDSFGSDQDWLGSDGDQFMNDVAVGEDVIVAVGAGEVAAENRGVGAIWHSTDGSSWSRVPHDEDLFGGPGESPDGSGDEAIESIVWWNDRFIAAGFSGQQVTVWTSTDGVAWNRSSVPTHIGAPPNEIVYVGLAQFGSEAVVVASDRFGNTVLAASTRDGVSWSDLETLPPEAEFVTILPISDRLMAFGDDGVSWRGAAWELKADGSWVETAGPWNDSAGSSVVAGSTGPDRALIGWASEDKIWGSFDGGDTWSTVAEFDTTHMKIRYGSRSSRAYDAVVDLVDEGHRIIAVGSHTEWSNSVDLGQTCLEARTGGNAPGTCRSDAAIWIGVPAG